MRHELTPSSGERILRSATPSRVATDEPQAVGSPGAGGHCAPGDSISETTVERNPLTDPLDGDIVATSDGDVIEVVDLLPGCVLKLREDSTTYTLSHDDFRHVVTGGRVIHRANLCPSDEAIQTPTSREVHGEAKS